MKIVVLGAGVIGVTTAYYLAASGNEVTVLDAQDGPGMETTFANGGQISVSHPEPWAAPGVPQQLLQWLGRKGAPLHVRLRREPLQWSWCLAFLRNCTLKRHSRHTELIAMLAAYSQQQLHQLQQDTGISFAHHASGTLHIFTDPRACDRSGKLAESRRALGISQQVLDRNGCLGVEPALEPVAHRLCGGIYAPDDETGDAHMFTRELAAVCEQRNVSFQFGVRIHGLERSKQRITAVMTSGGRIAAEGFVLALGVGSVELLRSLGLRAPVYPVKGYSVTLPVPDDRVAPRVNIIHEARRVVISRLGTQLRIAGGADIVGYDRHLDLRRAHAVLSPACELFPGLQAPEPPHYWTGLRPMTPDGPPVLGSTPYRNLYLNTGHGSLGWTLACGSSRAVADLVCGQVPDIELAAYSLARFESAKGNPKVDRPL